MDSATLRALLPELDSYSEMDDATFARDGGSLMQEHARHARLTPFPTLEEGEYRVRVDRVPEVQDKLAKKLGVPVPEVVTVRAEQLPVVVAFPDLRGASAIWWWARTGEVREFLVLRPAIEPVRLPGWTFAATIEHLGEDGNMLRVSPGFVGTLPFAYRTDPATCDHCRQARRRNATYVLRHEDGHFTRVGRNCLADYIGEASATRVLAAESVEAALLELLTDGWDGEGGGGGLGGALAALPATFLASVAMVIEKVGWCSRKLARETDRRSTADLAWKRMFPPPGKKDEQERELLASPITAAHVTDAEAALTWARAIPVDTDNDYLHNCRVIAGLGAWDAGKIGIGAAILMSYQKEQERLRRIEFERKLPSLHLGAIGDRFGSGKGKKAIPPLRARVLGVYTFDGNYGPTTIVRMQAPSLTEGHVHDLVWFASGSPDVIVDEAAVVEMANAQVAFDETRAAMWVDDDNARAAWRSQTANSDASFDEWLETDDGAAHRATLADTRVAHETASARLSAAQAPAEYAMRCVKAGDLVDVSGSIKRHETSKKTGRPETGLTRCALRLVVEPTLEAK